MLEGEAYLRVILTLVKSKHEATAVVNAVSALTQLRVYIDGIHKATNHIDILRAQLERCVNSEDCCLLALIPLYVNSVEDLFAGVNRIHGRCGFVLNRLCDHYRSLCQYVESNSSLAVELEASGLSPDSPIVVEKRTLSDRELELCDAIKSILSISICLIPIDHLSGYLLRNGNSEVISLISSHQRQWSNISDSSQAVDATKYIGNEINDLFVGKSDTGEISGDDAGGCASLRMGEGRCDVAASSSSSSSSSSCSSSSCSSSSGKLYPPAVCLEKASYGAVGAEYNADCGVISSSLNLAQPVVGSSSKRDGRSEEVAGDNRVEPNLKRVRMSLHSHHDHSQGPLHNNDNHSHHHSHSKPNRCGGCRNRAGGPSVQYGQFVDSVKLLSRGAAVAAAEEEEEENFWPHSFQDKLDTSGTSSTCGISNNSKPRLIYHVSTAASAVGGQELIQSNSPAGGGSEAPACIGSHEANSILLSGDPQIIDSGNQHCHLSVIGAAHAGGCSLIDGLGSPPQCTSQHFRRSLLAAYPRQCDGWQQGQEQHKHQEQLGERHHGELESSMINDDYDEENSLATPTREPTPTPAPTPLLVSCRSQAGHSANIQETGRVEGGNRYGDSKSMSISVSGSYTNSSSSSIQETGRVEDGNRYGDSKSMSITVSGSHTNSSSSSSSNINSRKSSSSSPDRDSEHGSSTRDNSILSCTPVNSADSNCGEGGGSGGSCLPPGMTATAAIDRTSLEVAAEPACRNIPTHSIIGNKRSWNRADDKIASGDVIGGGGGGCSVDGGDGSSSSSSNIDSNIGSKNENAEDYAFSDRRKRQRTEVSHVESGFQPGWTGGAVLSFALPRTTTLATSAVPATSAEDIAEGLSDFHNGQTTEGVGFASQPKITATSAEEIAEGLSDFHNGQTTEGVGLASQPKITAMAVAAAAVSAVSTVTAKVVVTRESNLRKEAALPHHASAAARGVESAADSHPVALPHHASAAARGVESAADSHPGYIGRAWAALAQSSESSGNTARHSRTSALVPLVPLVPLFPLVPQVPLAPTPDSPAPTLATASTSCIPAPTPALVPMVAGMATASTVDIACVRRNEVDAGAQGGMTTVTTVDIACVHRNEADASAQGGIGVAPTRGVECIRYDYPIRAAAGEGDAGGDHDSRNNSKTIDDSSTCDDCTSRVRSCSSPSTQHRLQQCSHRATVFPQEGCLAVVNASNVMYAAPLGLASTVAESGEAIDDSREADEESPNVITILTATRTSVGGSSGSSSCSSNGGSDSGGGKSSCSGNRSGLRVDDCLGEDQENIPHDPNSQPSLSHSQEAQYSSQLSSSQPHLDADNMHDTSENKQISCTATPQAPHAVNKTAAASGTGTDSSGGGDGSRDGGSGTDSSGGGDGSRDGGSGTDSSGGGDGSRDGGSGTDSSGGGDGSRDGGSGTDSSGGGDGSRDGGSGTDSSGGGDGSRDGGSGTDSSGGGDGSRDGGSGTDSSGGGDGSRDGGSGNSKSHSSSSSSEESYLGRRGGGAGRARRKLTTEQRRFIEMQSPIVRSEVLESFNAQQNQHHHQQQVQAQAQLQVNAQLWKSPGDGSPINPGSESVGSATRDIANSSSVAAVPHTGWDSAAHGHCGGEDGGDDGLGSRDYYGSGTNGVGGAGDPEHDSGLIGVFTPHSQHALRRRNTA